MPPAGLLIGFIDGFVVDLTGSILGGARRFLADEFAALISVMIIS
jgi:hypothetical protein